MSFDPSTLSTYPTSPGVYLMKNSAGKVLYVGKAKHLRRRLRQYFSKSGDSRATIPILLSQVAQIETIVVPTEKDSLLLENTLIKKHQPKYNLFLRDDKTYIGLMLNHKHPWPRLSIVRLKGKPPLHSLYFGPYTSAYAARQIFELMTKLFPLRQCSDAELKRRTRPCLLYGIKRCIAPCVGKCTREEYSTLVQGVVQFLKGKSGEVTQALKAQMERAAEALDFEQAAALLHTIQQIEHVTSSQVVIQAKGYDCDAIALHRTGTSVLIQTLFFREGKLSGSEHFHFSDIVSSDETILETFLLQHYEHRPHPPSEILTAIPLPGQELLSSLLSIPISTPKRGPKHKLALLAADNAAATFKQERKTQHLREQLLLDIAETLHLTRYPETIQCIDISHLSGTEIVAALVTYTDGFKNPKKMRLFKIRTVQKADDYGALREALSRHLIRSRDEESLPDLLIIDGGKGQLGIAETLFQELDIASVDLISLAKEEGKHDKGLRNERLFFPHRAEPLSLPPTSPLLQLLQEIRDTAHEAAIRFQRKRHSKQLFHSALDDIPGIGPIKKKRLLEHFGSPAAIRTASADALSQVPGLTAKDIHSLKKS